ncbi:MAG: hypothetical protein V4738_09580 [Pseudomonadota bacterium]
MDLLKESNWIGTFFPPAEYAMRFSGKLEFTPGSGVLLRYLLTDEGTTTVRQSRKRDRYLHGVLDSGERCTLLEPRGGERTEQIRGAQHSQSGTESFGILVLGTHVDPSQKFESATITYSGMQEFFFPTGFKDWEKFSPHLNDTEPTDFGTASVFTTGSFGFLPKDPMALFHSSDPDALEALALAIDDVETRFPDQVLQIKKDIGYALHLTFQPSLELHEVCSLITELANLFALLTHKPVLPQRVALVPQSTPREHVDIYLSLLRDRRTVDMCLTEGSHHDLPINARTVKLPKLIGKWLANSEHFRTVADSLQNQTSVANLHDLHGELVLNVALLESISVIAGKASQREKYQYPINRYASHWITELLSKELDVQVSQIGGEVSNVRNEIAHFGRPRKLLSKLGMKGLYRVNAAIQLIVLGYVLRSVGVPVAAVEEYQYRFLPG